MKFNPELTWNGLIQLLGGMIVAVGLYYTMDKRMAIYELEQRNQKELNSKNELLIQSVINNQAKISEAQVRLAVIFEERQKRIQ